MTIPMTDENTRIFNITFYSAVKKGKEVEIIVKVMNTFESCPENNHSAYAKTKAMISFAVMPRSH